MSGDWAEDMVMVETHYHNSTQPLEPPFTMDSEYTAYPQWSFRLVATLAEISRISPLRSLQIWAIVWLSMAGYLVAIRLALQKPGLPPLGAVVSTAAYLLLCAYLGFGVRGHLEGNFFFPQLAATALALAGIVVLQHSELNDTTAALFVVLWGGIVLPNFHLVPAAWFTLSGIVILGLRATNVRLRILYPFLVGCIVLLSWFPQGGARMANYANNNGWFLIRSAQLSDHGEWVAIGLSVALVVVLLALFRIWKTRAHGDPYSCLIPYAGAIAISILICLQSALYLALHLGSIYAIVKYAYLLAIEGAILLISVGWNSGPLVQIPPKWHNPLKLGCMLLFLCAQLPLISMPDDQNSLIATRQKLLGVRAAIDPNHRRYPQFSNFDYDRNFYLATAVMRIPLDQRTFNWLLRGAAGEEAFTWPEFTSILVPNGGFETGGLSPWLPYATMSPKISPKTHNGRFAVSEAGGPGSIYQDLKGLVPGATYTISAWASGEPKSTSIARIVTWDPGTKLLSESANIGLTEGWTLIKVSVKSGSLGVLRVHLSRTPARGLVYWDDVSVSLAN